MPSGYVHRVNCLELRGGEVRRKPLPRTRVNKDPLGGIMGSVDDPVEKRWLT